MLSGAASCVRRVPLAGCQDAGIVTVHDAGLLGDDRPFLVMELCPGGSLTRWMTADPRPSQRRVRDVGVRIARTPCLAAHLLGVLHRDVKPANILIDAYNNAGLADFGLAALIDPDTPLREAVEAITPAYAPPEVFAKKPVTEYADVYSLAAAVCGTQRSCSPLVGDHGDARASRNDQAAEKSRSSAFPESIRPSWMCC